MVNNSIKHINLDPNRYRELIDEYGSLSFRLLVEKSGIVYMKTKRYQFDYGRIILRNISKVLDFTYEYEEIDCILDILDGNDCSTIDVYDPALDPSDPTTAIDRMIEYCNPCCIDCGEYGDDCKCEEYVYGNSTGEFNPDYNQDFDIESTMMEISSSWK